MVIVRGDAPISSPITVFGGITFIQRRLSRLSDSSKQLATFLCFTPHFEGDIARLFCEIRHEGDMFLSERFPLNHKYKLEMVENDEAE